MFPRSHCVFSYIPVGRFTTWFPVLLTALCDCCVERCREFVHFVLLYMRTRFQVTTDLLFIHSPSFFSLHLYHIPPVLLYFPIGFSFHRLSDHISNLALLLEQSLSWWGDLFWCPASPFSWACFSVTFTWLIPLIIQIWAVAHFLISKASVMLEERQKFFPAWKSQKLFLLKE